VTYRYPQGETSADEFYMSDTLQGFCNCILLEGSCPLEYADCRVYVAPPPQEGAGLLVRKTRDRAGERRASLLRRRELLQNTETTSRFLSEMLGSHIAELIQKSPGRMEEVRAGLLCDIATAQAAPSPSPSEHWAVADSYQGIELAQVVLFNVRTRLERKLAESAAGELERIRRDEAVFRDVLGWRGRRIPITAVVADLGNSKDAGTRKARTRIRRSMQEGLSPKGKPPLAPLP
jgi:hypothetical protein